MIKNFRGRKVARFWERSDVERIPTDWADKIKLILDMLDAASCPEDMAVVGLRFHAYPEGTNPRFAVMASKAWRVSFGWKEGDAIDVDLEEIN